MSGRNVGAVQLVGPFRQYTEFKQGVAHHARIRGTSLLVLIDKILHDGLLKRYTLVSHIMFNSHSCSQFAGILRLVSPNTHRDSYYFISLLL